MLVNRYKPRKLSEIIGNKIALGKLKDFVSNFNNKKKKAIILYGGYGKTSSVYALANEINYEVVEINASDVRNKDNIHDVINSSMKQKSLFKEGKIILIEEVDQFSGLKDRGGITLLNSVIEESYFPIIMVADNPWDKKISNLRSKSELIEFKELTFYEIFMFLKKVRDKENFTVDDSVIREIAIKNKGDMRGAINDLDVLRDGDLSLLSDRDKKEDIFHVLKMILQGKNVDRIFEVINNTDLEELELWLDENLPLEYKGEELIDAYNMMSKADVFKGRIRRMQYWRFLVYVNTFLGVGVALSKKNVKSGFVRYKKSERILRLWRAKMSNSKRDSIAEKISKKTHTSKKKTLGEFTYFKIMLKNNKELCEELDFNEEEIKWVLK